MYFIVINCKIVGEGFPVVILHGWSLDHSVMSGCLEPNFVKRQGWKRIYIDLPGMGASKAQANIRNSDDMLQAVLDFITLQIPDEPFLIFGYSYGGLIARGVAHYLQKDVRGMLLIAPVIVSEPSERNLPEKRVIKADSSLLSRLPWKMPLNLLPCPLFREKRNGSGLIAKFSYPQEKRITHF